MLVLACSSRAKSIRELVALGDSLGVPLLFLRLGAAKSEMELESAFHLAKRAFREKKNVSPKLSNEALLFLACGTNFSRALALLGAKSPLSFLLAVGAKVPLPKLRRAMLLTRAKKARLGRAGKKKGKGHYSEGELAVEKMALARIMN